MNSSRTFDSFWVRALEIAPSSAVKYFKFALTDYLEALVVSAQHRDDRTLIQSVKEYFLFRRKDVAARPVFFPLQLHLNIPDEALFHPTIAEMEDLIADLCTIDNVSLRILLFLVHTKQTCCVRIWHLTTRSKPPMTSAGISSRFACICSTWMSEGR